MKKTNFSTRAYVMKNGQVMIRVRWNSKKNEVGFSVGYTIDPLKWDGDKQLVKSNTTHKIGGKIVYAREINNAIRSFLVCIEEVFAKYDLHSKTPTTTDLKELVNEKLGRIKQETVNEDKVKTLKDIFSEFLLLRPQEGNWGDKIHEKYDQMWTQLSSCDPNITLETLDQLKVQELVGWYIKNDYCNRTIQKQIRILKSFLRWVSRHGYTINSGVLEFKLRLKVIPRTVFALYGTATDADNTSVVFNNQKIEYNNESTLWVYSPLKYWNTQADHKFGAYAPYNSSRNFSFNPEGFPMITGFMVSQNVDNQESLLLSHPVDREVRAGGLDMSPVVFTFDPALTRINFRIKKESSLTDALHLNVLRMYNLKSSGNCTHNGNRIIWDTSSAPTNTFGYSTGFTNPQEVSYEGIIAWEDGALMVPQQISGNILLS